MRVHSRSLVAKEQNFSGTYQGRATCTRRFLHHNSRIRTRQPAGRDRTTLLHEPRRLANTGPAISILQHDAAPIRDRLRANTIPPSLVKTYYGTRFHISNFTHAAPLSGSSALHQPPPKTLPFASFPLDNKIPSERYRLLDALLDAVTLLGPLWNDRAVSWSASNGIDVQ